MSVIAIDAASRSRAWVVLAAEDGTAIVQRDLPGGELDRRLPAVLADLLATDLTAVVVLTGPGSYSGVRAGMAAALGVASARHLALHGIDNLSAVALAIDVADGTAFTVVSDAGRGGVYTATFVRRGSFLEQVSSVTRVAAAEVAKSGRVFATAEIDGVRAEQVDPVHVLAAAVPRALALPPLAAPGLHAVHVDSAVTRISAPGEER